MVLLPGDVEDPRLDADAAEQLRDLATWTSYRWDRESGTFVAVPEDED